MTLSAKTIKNWEPKGSQLLYGGYMQLRLFLKKIIFDDKNVQLVVNLTTEEEYNKVFMQKTAGIKDKNCETTMAERDIILAINKVEALALVDSVGGYSKVLPLEFEINTKASTIGQALSIDASENIKEINMVADKVRQRFVEELSKLTPEEKQERTNYLLNNTNDFVVGQKIFSAINPIKPQQSDSQDSKIS